MWHLTREKAVRSVAEKCWSHRLGHRQQVSALKIPYSVHVLEDNVLEKRQRVAAWANSALACFLLVQHSFFIQFHCPPSTHALFELPHSTVLHPTSSTFAVPRAIP